MDIKFVTVVLTFILLLAPWIALGFPILRKKTTPLASLLLLLVYAIYSAGTGAGSLRGFLVLGGYLLVSALLTIPIDSPRSFLVIATGLVLWLPFDVNWGERRVMSGVWQWPRGFGYPLSALTATVAGLIYFTCARPVGIRYEWRLDRKTLLYILNLLALLAALMIPLGRAISFLEFGLADSFSRPFLRAAAEPVVVAILIFIFTSIPEEIVFRGLIQNALTARAKGAISPPAAGGGAPATHSRGALSPPAAGGGAPATNSRNVWQERGALLAAALIFGAAHLNNPAGTYGTPNYAYMGMATLAGVFYGLAWRRGGIVAAALLHTAVDWIWHFFLNGNPAR